MLPSTSLLLPAALLLGSLQHVSAQSASDCDPVTNTTGCDPDPAFGTSYNFVFNATPSDSEWEVVAGSIDYTDDGAKFEIAEQGDSPTIRTKFYIFGGRVEIWMKAASGQGIISSAMLLSDDKDEIDWEFLGGNGTHVQSNFFGKGRGENEYEVDFEIDGGTVNDYHNYTIDWTNSSIEWYVDGEHTRTTLPSDANNTQNYPQTPMRIYLGPWAGGDPDNAQGTIEWAGGETDYSEGPFTMWVKNVHITDYGSGTEYKYTDNSGDWDSIEMLNTDKNSTAQNALNEEPEESVSEKFNNLSTGAKVAIFAGAGAVAAAIAGYAIFYCIRQRQKGAREAAAASQKLENERVELEGYKAAGIDPDGFSEVQPEYDARTGMATRDVQVAEYSTPNNEKYGAMGMTAAAAASRPLLRNHSDSPPGTPDAPPQNPYTDGFSPIDQHGPPTGPLPSVPDRSFSSPNPQMRSDSVGPGVNRSFSNPNGDQQGGPYWR